MAKEVMLALGSFAFSIDTAAYENFTRETSWRWPVIPRIGNTPSIQYTGVESDSITLEGTIYTERAGTGQIEALRELGGSEKPQLLVDQYGYVSGKWCILSISEKKSGFFADGVARKQQFTIKLLRYWDN